VDKINGKPCFWARLFGHAFSARVTVFSSIQSKISLLDRRGTADFERGSTTSLNVDFDTVAASDLFGHASLGTCAFL
jgi:hypothetical protein